MAKVQCFPALDSEMGSETIRSLGQVHIYVWMPIQVCKAQTQENWVDEVKRQHCDYEHHNLTDNVPNEQLG